MRRTQDVGYGILSVARIRRLIVDGGWLGYVVFHLRPDRARCDPGFAAAGGSARPITR